MMRLMCRVMAKRTDRLRLGVGRCDGLDLGAHQLTSFRRSQGAGCTGLGTGDGQWRATGPNLEPVVNFGYMGIIAKPLFLALRWVHEHIVSNWGWAILVLTLVINLAMLPTRIQMMKSALKMQRIQPEMNAIKEKFKKYKATDPRRAEMNKEMFDLQKREGVNMFGGCLPMLVQWPLLFAFYRMLLNTIELRQAPWMWLHNLAAPDPLHILPVSSS